MSTFIQIIALAKIRNIIGENVNILKNLFEQSQKLTATIEKLDDTIMNQRIIDQETIAQLTDLNDCIFESIKKFTKEIKELLDRLDKFAKDAMEK